MNEPNWLIVAFIGAFISVILPYIPTIIKYFIPYFFDNYILGKWNAYFFTFEKSNPNFFEDKWLIKRGLTTEYIVIAGDLNSKYRKYIGKLKTTPLNLNIELDGGKNKDNTFIKFPYLHKNDEKILVGIGLSIDYDGKTCSSICVLTKKQFNKSDILEIINKNSYCNKNLGLLKIK